MDDYTFLMHTNSDTEYGQDIINSAFFHSTMCHDDQEKLTSYTCDEQALQDYLHALSIVKKLAEQGYCTYECDNVVTAYPRHYIYVTWKMSDGLIKPPTHELSQICDLCETLVIGCSDVALENPEWQFSKTIYTEK